MTLEEFNKKLKKAENIEIVYQELNNNKFIATIKGIIKYMEKKKKITNEDLLNIINARFDKVEKDIDELKIKVNNIDDRLVVIEREATNHGWDLDPNK